MGNALSELARLGQSVWYDQMQRSLVSSGKLKKMIDEDDLRGLTSNPTIFEKGIGGSNDYQDLLAQHAEAGRNRDEIYEAIVVDDIGRAADVFRPVYEKTRGLDGYVSLEVSPRHAHDTRATIEEGDKLYRLLGRDNIMIKVPATPAGIPAIEELIARGINVNVTLIFSQAVYSEVMDAYLRGLERRVAEGKPVGNIASVASFFVSRIDSKADAMLEKKIAAASSDEEKDRLRSLLGKVAIANAKVAYALFRSTFESERAMKVRNAGAAVQRPLWASTGTKNPAYSDVLYVEQLIGADTVNTVPPATYDAFRDHGRVQPTLGDDLAGAEDVLRRFAAAGLSLDQITDELTEEGVKSFDQSFVSLLSTIEARRDGVERRSHRRDNYTLGPLQADVDATLQRLEKEKVVSRIWKKDAAVWKSDEAHQKIINNSLGWLTVAEEMHAKLPELTAVAEDTKAFRHVVLLGMGGSSLCAEVFRRSYGPIDGHPELLVLDSTVPGAVKAIEEKLDLTQTLFVVASKSGSTTEPAMFYRYFFDRVRSVAGHEAGRQFIAITDPDTQLDREATRDSFRQIFRNRADIGGRYSVLSYFGMVPAAIAGVNVARLLDRAVHAMHVTSDRLPAAENPAAMLGATMGTLAKAGRNKLTLLASKRVESLGLWIEQLVAESTGKEGRGVLPIAGEPPVAAERYGDDRLFVAIKLEGEPHADLDQRISALIEAKQPVVELVLRHIDDLGEAFLIWELATAICGWFLEIDPFDQPNVQESKDNTKSLLETFRERGSLPAQPAIAADETLSVFSGGTVRAASSVDDALRQLFALVKPGDYVAFTQYIPETPAHDKQLSSMRKSVVESLGVATTSGYAPRFLHSTGQLHKGGSDEGVFIQITADDPEDVVIPGEPFGFSVLKSAQAIGDFQSLVSRNRRALSVNLRGDLRLALQRLTSAVEHVVATGQTAS